MHAAKDQNGNLVNQNFGNLDLQVNKDKTGRPKATLSLIDAIAIIVGLVIGAGIFRTPSLVASFTNEPGMFLSVWVLGGIISLIGALSYAELATAFPHPGGDYHFLSLAFGRNLSFLFAWARLSVIQTGSIALLAFIFGDYASQIYNLGTYSSVIYAALVVILLTFINILGVSSGTNTQKLLTVLEVSGILLIVVAGLFLPTNADTESTIATERNSGSIGMALVIVLLTFGGWNEAAYISGELKAGKNRMAIALISSLTIITIIYLLVNYAFVAALGFDNLVKSEAAASDLMQSALGKPGAIVIAVLVSISALTSANATIFTGARTNYALGQNFGVFKGLGIWDQKRSTPKNAYLVQGVISLALVGLGIFTRSGFQTMLDYTAPVFWFFFFLVGVSLFRLRAIAPDVPRPFKVPLYPITPLIFCITSAYLFYSSITYTGIGALVGLAVVAVGVLVLLVTQKKNREYARFQEELAN